MKIRVKKKLYELSLWHRIIPLSLVQVVEEFNNEPDSEGAFVIDGIQLKDKVALVTGAYKGIGYAIAKRLIQDGAKVIITGRNEEKLRVATDRLKTDNVSWMVWDIADTRKCKDNFNKAESIFGKIDILVNNAGVNCVNGIFKDFDNMDRSYLHIINNINTIGTRHMCMSFIELYDKGTILNLLSNTAVRPAQDAYWISKWAMLSFTQSLGNSDKRKGISVNGLCPGPIRTDMSFKKGDSIYNNAFPNRRIGLPEEIAELAFLQIISGLKGISGLITVCDGGQSLK